ncbi:MAG: hypothetical protein M3N95_09485 [Actinomycetota bacterium]|nr:hypothetical protein [Actinomycetota bacterium]
MPVGLAGPREVGSEHLYGYGPVQDDIAGEIHRADTAVPEDAIQFIAPRQRGLVPIR